MLQPIDDLDGTISSIADLWESGSIVPFLGSAASFAGAPTGARLPDARAVAETLGRKADYPGDATADALTKVAQYAEDSRFVGRGWLLDFVARRFDSDLEHDSPLEKPYACALTSFVERIAGRLPPLIVTTNYDTVVERTLQRLSTPERPIPYVVMSHIMSGTDLRLLCSESLDDDPKLLVASKIDQRFRAGDYRGHTVIYKMHGTSRYSRSRQPGTSAYDSIVLTESDYINFLASDLLKQLPNWLSRQLGQAQFLFLGYSLEDWNFRVLLQRLQTLQGTRGPRLHWACRLFDESKPNGRIERAFWEKRNVAMYNMDLGIFLEKLALAITSKP